jgi:3-hydroxyacyl-[acyl-carrier-protein] dehydratase
LRFLLIDRITEWKPGERGKAVKNVALSEDFFDDHFPMKPIMPGVLLVEGMAQLGGVLLEEGVRLREGRKVKALMSLIESAKFRTPVVPGDQLEYLAEALSVNELGGRVKASARVNGNVVAECGLIFSFHAFDNPRLEAHRERILSLWTRGLSADEER